MSVKKEVFKRDKAEYIRITGDKEPMRYECMECGCVFYGLWHSKYSMDAVVCPVCEDETDPLFIKCKPE